MVFCMDMTPQPEAQPFWYSMLPRLGSAEEFAAARSVFAGAGFAYASICARLGVEHIYLFRPHMIAPLIAQPPADALEGLLRLYVLGYWLEESLIERLLGRQAMNALAALNLLRPDTGRPEMWFSPVLVLPVPGAIIACDRYSGPDGTDLATPPPDVVYLPVFQGTLEFVARLPQTPCDSMLEIGTGAGSAVVAQVPFAQRIWATDITSRSVHFAAFNCALAGVANVCAVEGDLYQPVEGLTFDRIATHPPYVPARESKTIFREGGEDGEQIARRIVEGVPRFLRPNGEFWGMWMASDRKGERSEQRVRKWLGASEAEFDIALAVDSLRTPQESIAYAVSQGNAKEDELLFFRELWKATDTQALVHGSVLIRRHGSGRPAVTVRTQTGKGFTGRHLEWLLDWEVASHGADALEMLLATRPALSPQCRLRSEYHVEDGRFAPTEFILEAEGPVKCRTKCPGWLVEMVSGCDGSRTSREWFEALRGEGRIPETARVQDFAGMIAALVSSCVLVLPNQGNSVLFS